MRSVWACVALAVAVGLSAGAAGCNSPKKEPAKTKPSDDPKSRAGQLIKKAKDTREDLEKRNDDMGKELDKLGQ